MQAGELRAILHEIRVARAEVRALQYRLLSKLSKGDDDDYHAARMAWRQARSSLKRAEKRLKRATQPALTSYVIFIEADLADEDIPTMPAKFPAGT